MCYRGVSALWNIAEVLKRKMEGMRVRDVAVIPKKGRARTKMSHSENFGEESRSSGKQVGVWPWDSLRDLPEGAHHCLSTLDFPSPTCQDDKAE